MKVGFIGSGPISDFHISALLNKKFQIEAIGTRKSSDNTRKFAERHNLLDKYCSNGWEEVLDRNLDVNLTSYVCKSIKKGNTVIFYNSSKNSKIQLLKKKGAILIKSKLDNKKRFDLRIIKKKIFSLGIRNLLVEGGNELTKNMLDNRLVDQFYLFKSPKNLSKNKKYVLFTLNNILKNKYRIKSKMISNLAKDNITIYKR